jgi:hypothetical protein
MDPILNYEINKFLLLFIPDLLLKKIPSLPGAMIVSLVPYTPINLLIYACLFVVLYFTNMGGMGSKVVCDCKFNKPIRKEEPSLLPTFFNAYLLYLPIAFIINYGTFTTYHLHQMRAI